MLLGFSYGGFVVSGALEHIAPRVAHLVDLDAFVPEVSGQSVGAVVRGAVRWCVTDPWGLRAAGSRLGAKAACGQAQASVRAHVAGQGVIAHCELQQYWK